MTRNVESRLEEAYRLATEDGDYEKAVAICTELIDSDPKSPDPYRTRAAIHAFHKNPAKAVADITQALRWVPEDPGNLFFSGWWKMEMGDERGAIDDLTSCLSLAEQSDFHNYDESAYFFRALANLRLGRLDAARQDCENVDDGFVIYLSTGRHSKTDILRLTSQQ